MVGPPSDLRNQMAVFIFRFFKGVKSKWNKKKKQPPSQFDPIADVKSKLLFAVIVIVGMLFCKFVLGW